MSLKLFLYLIIPLFVLSMLVAPASSISVSCTSGGGGHAAFSSMSYDLDDSTTLRADAVLDSGSITQSTQASGSGQNAINQQVGGGASSVGNAILSNGAFSASTSATASTEGAGIQQQVMAVGDASASLSGAKGTSSAGQEAGVVSGVISASQSVSTSGSTSAGSGVAASQITEISGLAGSVGSGAFSEDGAMVASGSFLGEGILKAELSSNTLENVKLSGNVATDGVTWMDSGDLQQVAENGGGVSVHGLRAVPGGMGTFDMNAASLDAGALANMGQVATQALGGSSTSYALTGYRWNTRDPKVQLYLKDDSNLQGRGLTGVQVQTAITNAANTWDDAVAQNIFADGSTVIIDPNKNTDNPYDGSNVLAWKYLSDAPNALAYSRTRYNYPIVDGYWTALESDVSFNTAFAWSTTGVDGTPHQSGDPIDVETVALHELGHTIGLGDLYTLPDGDARKSDFSQIMNSYNDVQRTLGNGDIAGAQTLYGKTTRDNIGIYRSGMWYLYNNKAGTTSSVPYGGLAGDVPITGDWNGDGIVDIGIYRSGMWYLYNNKAGTASFVPYGGLAGDVPVTGDWNGDGIADIGIYRSGMWYLYNNKAGTASFVPYGGLAGDVPVTGDWNGDGIADIGIYRSGMWYLYNNKAGTASFVPYGGLAGDVPVTGDWNGDGPTKVGIYRSGTWYLNNWDTISYGGLTSDVPVTGDWNGN